MSNFNWENTQEQGSSNEAEKLPVGRHAVTITKVIHGGKNGPFVSKAGDPKILIIMEDSTGKEAATMVCLSDNAAWVLARLLKVVHPKVDLAAMTKDGVKPAQFADPEFANVNLTGRRLTIDLEDAGNGYMDCVPVEAPDAKTEAKDVPSDSDIPF